MPTVMRIGSHRFFFYSNEGSEPPHVHVQSGEKSAKFWLDPVALARSSGYDAREILLLHRYVEQHGAVLEEAWHAFFHRP